MEILIAALKGLLIFCAVVAAIVGYVIWRNRRQVEDATAEAAARSSGGGGGPKEPA